VSDPKILIAYVTRDGHTRRVARRLAAAMDDDRVGVEAVVSDLDRVPDPFEAEGFDGVILAAPVRFGRHPRRMRRYAGDNRDTLERLPSAFVSVSGAAGSADPEGLDEAEGYVERFIERTGWTPDRTACVGGEMAYTKYSPLVRLVVKAASARAGGPVDTSRDHEFTDWKAVDGFAREFASVVRERRPDRRAGDGDATA